VAVLSEPEKGVERPRATSAAPSPGVGTGPVRRRDGPVVADRRQRLPAARVHDPELGQELASVLIEHLAAHHPGTREVDGHVDRDPSVLEDQDAIGQQHRLLDVVGDEKDTGSIPTDQVGQ